jgi:hypothetical protein
MNSGLTSVPASLFQGLVNLKYRQCKLYFYCIVIDLCVVLFPLTN